MKSITKISIVVLLFFSFIAKADVNSRREELLSIIDEELREVVRLNKQSNGRNPDFMIRMAELWLEKARIVRESETSSYLKIPPKKRKRINRDKFYKKSRSYFMQAQKIGNNLLKKYKRFSGKGDVYYILAYNAKEFQQNEKAKRYLQLAVENSNLKSMTSIKSYLALAEIYYNNSQYEKALPLYEKGLNTSLRDKWWTKDAYSLAWTYYKLGRTNRAISLMKDVIEKSKSPRFIDMGNTAQRDLAILYAETGKINKAVSSLRKSGTNFGKKMVSLGNYLEGQSKYHVAQKIYENALISEIDQKSRNEINLKLLSIYERFGKIDKHLKSVEELLSSYKRKELRSDQVDILKYHAKRTGALVQKQVVGNLYETRSKERSRRADFVVRYFSALAILNPSKASEVNYLSGETMYAVGNYDKAIEYYDRAKSSALKVGNRKILKKANEGMIAALGNEGVSKSVKDRYMAKALESYVASRPKDKKAFTIYQRLFVLYMDGKDIPSAERVLLKFRKYFSQASVKQEAMLAEVMDYHKEKNDKEAIKRWVGRIKRREFIVSKKYAQQVNLLLLTMQFEGVKRATSKGDKVSALRIYLKVYKSKESSPNAKKKAAYNMAIYFYELGDAERSYKWMERAISHMNSSDVKKFEKSILVTSRDLFNQRRISYAADISTKALNKLCQQRSKNKDLFFRNSVIMNLAGESIKKAEKIILLGRKCGIENTSIQKMKIELLNSYYEAKRWSKFENLLAQLKKIESLGPELSLFTVKLIGVYERSGRVSKAKKTKASLIREFERSRRKGDYPVETLDLVALSKLSRLKREYQNFNSTKLSFPEKKYNRLLKSKFDTLNRLTDKTIKIFDLRSGRGMIAAYRLLVEAYEKFGKEIKDFSPPVKNVAYIKSFKKQMNSISIPILKKASSLRQEARSKIGHHGILSSDNSFFLNLSLDNVTEFYPLKDPVIMDRGGRR